MPRRPPRGPNRIWNQNNDRHHGNQFTVSEHDDRGEIRKVDNRGKNIRRVSFKQSGQGAGNRQFNNKTGRNLNLAIRSTLDDDDDMIDFPTGLNRDGNYQRNTNMKIRRRGSPIPRAGHGQQSHRKLIPGTSEWFLVTIPHGQKYDKEFILKTLQGLVEPEPFMPHYFKVETTAVCFFVDDIKTAQTLLNADRRVTLPDGFKMLIRVRHSIPTVQIDANLKEKMKLAMVKRYNASNKALNLTKFHADPELKDIFCGLFRPTIMLAAIDIISENIPDLEALDLSDNKIHLLDHLKCLATKLPFLKILHLANNKITTPNSLDALKECQLVDLVLKGNPLRDRLREETVYISEIRKRFSKLVKLDFVDLPPQMGFDIPDEVSIPQPNASYLCNYNGADIVRQFIAQYFVIYDSDNRQPLLDAYHEHAMFSLTATYSSQQSQKLASYLVHNRNILRIKDFETRSRHLKNGRLPVVSFLSELPPTQHDPLSFAVDLSFFTPKMMLLTVTGIFRERNKPNNENLRSFQRTLVIVPSGTGFCIKNEMVHVTNATIAQIKAAFKAQAAPAPAPAPTPAEPTPTTSTAAAPPIDNATKVQMIQSLSQLSNMNLEWSEKCLMETNWDYDKASFVFTSLNNQNRIPAEAFAK